MLVRRFVGLVGGLLELMILAGCAPEPLHLLAIDLRTDLVANEEIDSVEVVLGEGPEALHRVLALEGTEALADGVRVAEFELPAATYDVLLLVRLRDVVRVERPLRVELNGSTVATVAISRRCLGVSCPPSGAPRLTSCLAGRCVDPRCTEEELSYCGDYECVSDEDCPARSECSTQRCEVGVCLYWADDAVCAGGELCDVDEGCVSVPGESPRVVGPVGRVSEPGGPRGLVEVAEDSVLLASTSVFFLKESDGAGWVAASIEVPEGVTASRSTTTRNTANNNHLWADDAVVLSLPAGTTPVATLTSNAGYRSERAQLEWGVLPRRLVAEFFEWGHSSPIEVTLDEPHVLIASVWLEASSEPATRGYSRESIVVDDDLCSAGRQDAVLNVPSLDGSAFCVRRLAAGPHRIAVTGEANPERVLRGTSRALLLRESRTVARGSVGVDATPESRSQTAYVALRETVTVPSASLFVAHAYLRATDNNGFVDGHLDVDDVQCARSRHVRASGGADAEVPLSCVRVLEAGEHEIAVGHYHEGPIVPDRYELGYVLLALEL